MLVTSIFLVNALFVNVFALPLEAPIMGFNTWNRFACNINETLIKTLADAVVERGFLKAGYKWLNVDDCWQSHHRDKKGRIIVDKKTFPSGMKALGDYIHSKGLKYGLYSSAGTKTCQGRAGSLNYEQQDADFYVEVGADLLKYDNCYNEGLPYIPRFTAMRDALQRAAQQQGRPEIIYSICEWGYSEPWEWAPPVGHYWRTTLDICNKFSEDGEERSWGNVIVEGFFKFLDLLGLRTIILDNAQNYLPPGWVAKVAANAPCSVLSILDQNVDIANVSSPEIGFNDMDMLEVGNNGMTFEEEKTHFILWAAMKSPLILGSDVSTIDEKTVALLTHDEIIAINQDSLGKSVLRVSKQGSLEIWAGPLSDGFAVVLLNRSKSSSKMHLNFSLIPGLSHRNYQVRNVYERKDIGVFVNGLDQNVPSHGAILLKLTDAGEIAVKVQ